MAFTFNTGQLVLNLLPGERMTAARLYRVHSSYDGHSGCGAQEWCRVADDSGKVIGYDPDRFIAAPTEDRTPNPYIAAAALRSRKALDNLLAEFQGESFAVLRKKLKGLHDDATGMLLMSAEGPNPPQVTFFDADTQPRDDRNLNTMVSVDALPVGWMRHYTSRGVYTFEHRDQSIDLKAGDYREAMATVRLHIGSLRAEVGDLSFWAATVTADQTEQQKQEFADAVG